MFVFVLKNAQNLRIACIETFLVSSRNPTCL